MPNKKSEPKPAHKTTPVIIAVVVFVVGIGIAVLFGPVGDDTTDQPKNEQPQQFDSTKSLVLYEELKNRSEDPEDQLSYSRSLASSHADIGNYDEAIDIYLEVIETSNDPKDLDVLGQMYLVSGDEESANKYFAMALEGYNQDPEKYQEEIQLINGETIESYE